ncbi:TolC family protein [Dinoroseobacter sp. S76]|uniref:TolC family protein n=1 Tax=Dinoroseobacter sp. S76 TaxID=3415124 RepID=UPI003C7BD728
MTGKRQLETAQPRSGLRGLGRWARAACTGLVLGVSATSAGAASLEEAVRAALTTNPALQATNAEMRAAAYDLIALERNYLPTVTAFGEAGGEWVDDPGSLSADDNDEWKATAQLGVGAELTLFDGYQRANRIYDNAARVDGRIFALLDASETMALNATEAYFDVVRHRMLVDAAQRNLDRHIEIADQVRALVQGGRLPSSDALTADDRLQAASLAIVQLRQALRDANSRYERVIGAAPGGGMQIPRLSNLPATRDALVQAALRNSFRLRQAQSAIDQSVYEQEIAKGTRLPQVTLNAGVTQGENRDGQRGSETDAFLGLRMNWTLYSGGRPAEDKAAIERSNQAFYSRQDTMREVEELAQRAWSSLQSNTESAILADRQLRANREIVRQFREEFTASSRSLLDVLEAERALYNVEFRKISTDASFAFSQFRVLAAQSRLAAHFGIAESEIALEPTFQARALVAPRAIFDTEIPALE